MNKYSERLGIALFGTFFILSCSDDISNNLTTVRGITVKSEAFQYDEPLSKASYTVDSSKGFILNWTDGDTIGIYPVGGDQVAFPISSGSGSSAKFDGGAWAVRSTYTYAAYYPFNRDYYNIAQTELPVSYTGQTQTGNGSTASLGKYDYQVSEATAPDGNGNINITVKHLGCFVRLQLTVPVVDTFTSLTLTSDKGQFVTAGTFDLTSTSPTITGTATSNSMSMSLSGVSNTAEDKVVTLYMMMAPSDLSSSTIVAELAGENQSYTAAFSGKNMQKGKAYSYAANLDYAFVDLGLSVKWATMNVGAVKSTDYGDYFAWGEVTPKSNYNWSTYKYCKGSQNTQTKYCNYSYYGYNGYTDSKTVLDSIDDAASVNWGGSWRMPTRDEQDELLNTDNCTWQWYSSGNTEFNGVAGYKVTSNKSGYSDKFIFLPAAGCRYDTCFYSVGSSVSCWSSSLPTSDVWRAYELDYDTVYGGGTYSCDRYYGQSVRPVYQ